jgi:hypothetical protein
VRRWRVAILSAGCVATLLLLWLSFEVAPPWPWWVRAAALFAIPLSFFTAIAVELSVAPSRAERNLSVEEKRRRHRDAWQGVSGDIALLASHPELYVRPLLRTWELWRTHPLKPPPDGPSVPVDR